MSERAVSNEPETRFSGYGDRVGSGVELTSTRWTGGEIVSDPNYITKTIKPKRFYYSPIGDGVVAADGIELKYVPKNLEPRVSVTQQRTVERSKPGQTGLRITEKLWSEGGHNNSGHNNSGFENLINNQNENVNSLFESNVSSKSPHEPNNNSTNFNTGSPQINDNVTRINVPIQQKAQNPSSQTISNAQYNEPLLSQQKEALLSNTPKYSSPLNNSKPVVNKLDDLLGATSPIGVQLDPRYGRSTSDTPKAYTSFSPLGTNDRSYTGTPNSFKTSSSLYEPGMRYEIKKDYLVSNPRELIHQYATTTPINIIPGVETTTQYTKETYHSTVEETSIGPYPPYNAGNKCLKPNNFVRQLRNESMTPTQRTANQNIQSCVQSLDEKRIEEIRRQTTQYDPNSEIQTLTSRLVSELRTQDKKH